MTKSNNDEDMSALDPKTTVRRFNAAVIGLGERAAFDELMSPDFVNRSAPPGMPSGGEGLWNTFENVLRPALADLTVTIHDQIGEGDKVATRKTITGKHIGPLLGAEATGRSVSIEVIDIVRIEDGRYVEHWGMNNLAAVVADLKRG